MKLETFNLTRRASSSVGLTASRSSQDQHESRRLLPQTASFKAVAVSISQNGVLQLRDLGQELRFHAFLAFLRRNGTVRLANHRCHREDGQQPTDS